MPNYPLLVDKGGGSSKVDKQQGGWSRLVKKIPNMNIFNLKWISQRGDVRKSGLGFSVKFRPFFIYFFGIFADLEVFSLYLAMTLQKK